MQSATIKTVLPCLQVEIVPLSVVLGASSALRLLPILTVHSFTYPRPCQLLKLRDNAAEKLLQDLAVSEHGNEHFWSRRN
jgi:hypothetical protein